MVAMRTFGALASAAVTLVAPAGGSAGWEAVKPVRTIVAPAKVLTLGLEGRSLVFVVDETRTTCPHVELWLTGSRARYRFPSTVRLCKQGLSTGVGIPSVAVTGTRALWLSYMGGNTREWQLWTATPTRRTPARLEFLGWDADDPNSPVVLGPGTARGVPYAVERTITYFGADGTTIFETTVPSPVRALAAGSGPGDLEFAALLADGSVVGLDGAGTELMNEPRAPGTVRSVRVCGLGLAVQVGDEVEITAPGSQDSVVVRLPSRATMLDVAQSRILYLLSGDLWAVRIATGARAHLIDGSPANPAYGQIDSRGLAWSRARTVGWKPGLLP